MKVKLLTILILFLLVSCAPEEGIQVSIINDTMDNIEIGSMGGQHIAQGEKHYLMTIDSNLLVGSFRICRGYGCLALVVVEVEFPDSETISPSELKDEFRLTENPRDTFDADYSNARFIKSITVTPWEY